jgi:tRNA nucleotidyltransferase (CCA-adding enzyme)
MDSANLFERLTQQPGARDLLAAQPAGAYLVGGAVRDLLLGRAPRELDVVLEESPDGDVAFEGGGVLERDVAVEGGEDDSRPASSVATARLAAELAACVRARGEGIAVSESTHERFGTASVAWDGTRIDIAAARRERYAAPGALPTVEPASLREDLLRRDFTVNAIALALDGASRGELRAAPGALEDLRAGVLRVLHERSFSDDPTRLWRLARYRARLGFAIEERTAELAAAAIAAGAPATVSGARLGAELRLALSEVDPRAALVALDDLGLLTALHPRLRFEPALVERALGLLASVPADGGEEGGVLLPGVLVSGDRPDLLLLATLTLPLALRADGDRRGEVAALLDRLQFAAGEREHVAAAVATTPALIDALDAAVSPSQVRAATLHASSEAVALAGALSESAARAARLWLGDLRHVRLRIGGQDLLRAGLPQGPEIGRRLEEVLRMRLDGELRDEREAQLHAALALE